MTIIQYCVGLLILATLLTSILFVLFGQITVRKLRKNPATRDSLGLEYVSGWDIINAAQALAFPGFLSKKLENGPLSFMHANSLVLKENTNRLDRFLGSLFYWMMIVTGMSGALLVLLDSMGMFKS
jgi:hypothetical protein